MAGRGWGREGGGRGGFYGGEGAIEGIGRGIERRKEEERWAGRAQNILFITDTEAVRALLSSRAVPAQSHVEIDCPGDVIQCRWHSESLRCPLGADRDARWAPADRPIRSGSGNFLFCTARSVLVSLQPIHPCFILLTSAYSSFPRRRLRLPLTQSPCRKRQRLRRSQNTIPFTFRLARMKSTRSTAAYLSQDAAGSPKQRMTTTKPLK